MIVYLPIAVFTSRVMPLPPALPVNQSSELAIKCSLKAIVFFWQPYAAGKKALIPVHYMCHVRPAFASNHYGYSIDCVCVCVSVHVCFFIQVMPSVLLL